jgi:polar amino acid transport system substrate-binding protein
MLGNKKIMARVLIIFISLLCLFSGCESLNKSGTKADDNSLRIGVSPTYAPIIYKQGEEIVGLEADLGMELAKYLGRPAKLVVLDWEDQIPALLDKRIDIIMSGMSITKKREYQIAFTIPYFRTGQMALLGTREILSLQTGYYTLVAQSAGLNIGVIKGTTGETFVNKNFRRAKGIISYTTSEGAVKAMKWNKIDLLIYDSPNILMLGAKYEADGLKPLYALLTEEYLAWGIRKTDADLVASANKFLIELEKSGKLDTIVKRWIPIPD